MRRIIIALVLTLIPSFAAAFERVNDQQTFVSLISDKTLSNRLYGVTLNVSPDGSIAGGAWGWDITGNWTWDNGFFCRDMAWGGDSIGFNCQLVEARNGNELRFISDQGAGDQASFKLR